MTDVAFYHRLAMYVQHLDFLRMLKKMGINPKVNSDLLEQLDIKPELAAMLNLHTGDTTNLDTGVLRRALGLVFEQHYNTEAGQKNFCIGKVWTRHLFTPANYVKCPPHQLAQLIALTNLQRITKKTETTKDGMGGFYPFGNKTLVRLKNDKKSKRKVTKRSILAIKIESNNNDPTYHPIKKLGDLRSTSNNYLKAMHEAFPLLYDTETGLDEDKRQLVELFYKIFHHDEGVGLELKLKEKNNNAKTPPHGNVSNDGRHDSTKDDEDGIETDKKRSASENNNTQATKRRKSSTNCNKDPLSEETANNCDGLDDNESTPECASAAESTATVTLNVAKLKTSFEMELDRMNGVSVELKHKLMSLVSNTINDSTVGGDDTEEIDGRYDYSFEELRKVVMNEVGCAFTERVGSSNLGECIMKEFIRNREDDGFGSGWSGKMQQMSEIKLLGIAEDNLADQDKCLLEMSKAAMTWNLQGAGRLVFHVCYLDNTQRLKTKEIAAEEEDEPGTQSSGTNRVWLFQDIAWDGTNNSGLVNWTNMLEKCERD